MKGAPALLCALLLLAAVRDSRGTCYGHNCDEQHGRAKSAGLLGAVHAAAAQRPKECRGSKTYPVEGRLKAQEMPTPVVNIRWAGKDADVDKVRTQSLTWFSAHSCKSLCTAYTRPLQAQCAAQSALVHHRSAVSVHAVRVCADAGGGRSGRRSPLPV